MYDFPRLFNRVVIEQVRFSYTFTEAKGSVEALKLRQRVQAECSGQMGLGVHGSKMRQPSG